ncbi:hypothetical protein L195_g055954, partial [Trifolium pratense]
MDNYIITKLLDLRDQEGVFKAPLEPEPDSPESDPVVDDGELDRKLDDMFDFTVQEKKSEDIEEDKVEEIDINKVTTITFEQGW